MLSSSISCTWLRGVPALLALAGPAQAQVTIRCDQAVVTSRVPCVLTASHGDGKPRTWKWSVVGLPDASRLLDPTAPDKVRVRTPVTLVERTFTVVAEDAGDPSVTGTFVLRITPNPQSGSGERALTEGLFPDAFTPSLRPFLGHPERLRTAGSTDAHAHVLKIAFCDDPIMGALDRCWLLANGHGGLEAVKVAGDRVAVPGFPYFEPRIQQCLAVAALPPGPGEVPEGAPRLVFCERGQGPHGGYRVYALEPDGRKRLLAGGSGHGRVDGPGGTARFGAVNGLALDRGGNVYVCEYFLRIRKISLDGQVSTVSPEGSVPGGPPVRNPQCLVIDPATGDLYVGGPGYVARLSPEGKWTWVIGGRNRALAAGAGNELAPLGPGRVPLDTRFEMHVLNLAMHGRELLLATDSGIDAFHLDTRRLARIVPLDPGLTANRLGPVAWLNPQLPASKCAAMEGCGPLATTKEALCLVAMGEGVAELELPDDPVTSILDPPESSSVPGVPAGESERKEKKQELPELDNLWPGLALETGTVRADGLWGAYHWRSAAPRQRFSGQCQVEARGLSQGWAQISLLFTDGHGKVLGHSEPAGPGMPDVVSAPAHGRTLIRMAGTAPAGTDRVALCLRVVKGNPGAVVSFRDVTFHQLP